MDEFIDRILEEVECNDLTTNEIERLIDSLKDIQVQRQLNDLIGELYGLETNEFVDLVQLDNKIQKICDTTDSVFDYSFDNFKSYDYAFTYKTTLADNEVHNIDISFELENENITEEDFTKAKARLVFVEEI